MSQFLREAIINALLINTVWYLLALGVSFGIADQLNHRDEYRRYWDDQPDIGDYS